MISKDDKPITIFAIYCSINVILMTLQGFFCSLLYCFLNGEVRETLSRRFQTTRIWYRWKDYFEKQPETITKDNRTRLDSRNSISPVN